MSKERRTRTKAWSSSGLLRPALVAGGLLAAREAVRRSRARDYTFRDKTVLITGGSRGLELVLARQLADEGARLAIAARDADTLERARAELAGRGAEVLAVPCDIADRAACEALVGAAVERFGRVDVLVNNAGIIQVGPLEAVTLDDFAETMGVHFWGPLYLTLAVLPGMRERRAGRIVNVSSFGGKVSQPHFVPYSASKFALTGLSEGLRAELAKDGIAVTTICPGILRTGSHRQAIFKGQHHLEYTLFSIGAALPLTAMSAESAARRILTTCRQGDAEVVFPRSVALLSQLHGLSPGLTADALAALNRLLPRPGGIGIGRAKGSESETPLSRSPLTALAERAAARNNEGTRAASSEA